MLLNWRDIRNNEIPMIVFLVVHSIGHANVGLFFVSRIVGTSYKRLMLLQARVLAIAAVAAGTAHSSFNWITVAWIRVGTTSGSFVALMLLVGLVKPEMYGAEARGATRNLMKKLGARFKLGGDA